MVSYEIEVKKLDEIINELEEKIKTQPDPIFHGMLKRFKDLREKYMKIMCTNPSFTKQQNGIGYR